MEDDQRCSELKIAETYNSVVVVIIMRLLKEAFLVLTIPSSPVNARAKLWQQNQGDVS